MRAEICLRPFAKYDVNKEKIDTTYYNKYYQKKMDLKVADFYWASSRKSYLPCGQSYDVFSYDAIVYCLKAGARLINLDIFSDENGEPVVRAKTMMAVYGKPLNFEKCLKLIRRYSWIDAPKYPLILFLSLNTENRRTMTKIAYYLKNVFEGKFINKRYSFNGRNGLYPFGGIPIKDMLGNIAIITNKYPTIGSLDEYIHGVTDEKQEFITKFIYSKEDEQYGGMIVKQADIGNIIDHNKRNCTLVFTLGEISYGNIHNPKSDIYNPNPEDCWKFGCQFVLMNYQLYDKNMMKNLEKFKDRGLVLKPEKLRYVDKPPLKISKQHEKAYYKPRTLEQPGWYSINT